MSYLVLPLILLTLTTPSSFAFTLRIIPRFIPLPTSLKVVTDPEKAQWGEKAQLKWPKHVEVVSDFHPLVDSMVSDILLETGDASWQAADFLPTFDNFDPAEIHDLQSRAAGLSPELLIVLIGDMITEEALPTYQTLLNTFEGCADASGQDSTAWARWSRGWTSEENRHGDLLNRYLYLSGRCDMRAIECTIQHLITSGFNPGADSDPYKGFVYTSFQERATKISHGNVGRVAKEQGDTVLQKICSAIAGDEARHEKAYQRFSQEILDRDPTGFIESCGSVLRQGIVMPAVSMSDGTNPNLYDDFSQVAQSLGVYTAFDYAEITRHLVKVWALEGLEGLGGNADREREYICKLPGRYEKLAERESNKKKKAAGQANTEATDAKRGMGNNRGFRWILE